MALSECEGGARRFSKGMKDSIQAYPLQPLNGKACCLCVVLMQEAQLIDDYQGFNGARKARSLVFLLNFSLITLAVKVASGRLHLINNVKLT